MGKKSEGITEVYANAKRNELISKLRHGELPPQLERRHKKELRTFDSVAQEVYADKALHNRANTRAKQRYEKHLQPFLGKKGIEEITVDDLKSIQRKKAAAYAPKSVNNIMGEISVIFNFAIKKGYITASPMKQVDKLKVDNRRERFLSIEEIKLLLETVHDDDQLHTFVLLAVHTGARVGALCKLKAGDIDFTHGTITMLDEKNAETYTCYLEDATLIAMLHKRIEQVGRKLPVLDDGLSEANLTDRVKRKAGKVLNDLFSDEDTDAKMKVVVHTLRHTFASHLAINGVPILTIQKLMNHKDINQTMRYAKLAPDSGRDAISKLYSN
jgi:integrase